MSPRGFPAGLRGALWTLLAASAILLPFLGAREIRNPDEPRDAEIGREAAAGGWGVVPELNGKPFLERPPLYYWGVAGAIWASGGPSDAAVKLPSALLGIVAVLSVWIAAEVLLGPGSGLPAALLLLGMPYFVLRFRTAVGDTGLAAFSSLSVALFFVAWKHGSRPAALGAGLAAGLAFLCKGLLGFGIPALVAGSFLAVRRDWGAILRLRLWAAVLVGVATAAPWVMALHSLEGTAGLHRFFVWNHLGRFSADADHAKPAWFYVCILWTALPLTLPAIAMLLHRPPVGPPIRTRAWPDSAGPWRPWSSCPWPQGRGWSTCSLSCPGSRFSAPWPFGPSKLEYSVRVPPFWCGPR